jgi:hypothetical protein
MNPVAIQEIHCPLCRKALYLPASDKIWEESNSFCCSHCQTPYRQTLGTLTALSSHLEQISSRSQHPKFIRCFRLRLQTKSEIKEFQFSAPQSLDPEFAIADDSLSLIHTQYPNKLGELVCILNHTLERTFCLPGVHQAAKLWGLKVAGVVLTLSAVFAITAGGFRNILLISALSLSAASGMVAYHQSKPKLRSKTQLAQLLQEQDYLEKIYRVQLKLDALDSELDANAVTLKRFAELRRKMLRNREIYDSKLPTVERAERLLHEQKALLERLIGGYTQLIDIIEIERETLALTELLPDNLDAQILQRMRELELLEEKKMELTAAIAVPKELLS